MDRFEELRVFVAVTETGAFARAAAGLNSSPPAVTRRIAALEDRLGVQLFNRTTRRVSLTEPGFRLFETARRILADLDAAESEAAGQATIPTGHLTITASVTFGRMVLTPIVTAFQKAYPQVTVTVRLLDRVVNLVEEGIDLAVRIGQLPDSTLIARKVGAIRPMLVSCANYLQRKGRPVTPEDLKTHDIIAFTGLMQHNEWTYQRNGRPGRIHLTPKFEINDATACLNTAMTGEGIAPALSYMVRDALASGKLEWILKQYSPPEIPVQIVYPQSRLIAPKVRAFVDFAAPRLRAALS